jgi:tetratricopeptide (TPR) repeat protein
MGFFNIFKKDKKPPKEFEKIFEKMKIQLEGKKLADEAISYQNLGEYERAYNLLMESIEKFNYLPAITLIGTTALLKGDIEKAIEWFEINIKNPPKGGSHLIIEWYANLGLIYFRKKEDIEKARMIYEKALCIPKPPEISDGLYNTIISGVHRDIAVVYLISGEISLANNFARKRLAFDPDCASSKKVLAMIAEQQNSIPYSPRLANRPSCGTVSFGPDGKANIHLSGGGKFPSEFQSLIHSNAHVFLRMTYDILINGSPQARSRVKGTISSIEKCMGVVNGKWTDEQEERFARQYELYIFKKSPEMNLVPPRGISLDPILIGVFDEWSGK